MRINQDINIIESLDEWWQLFLSLVNWQIKFDKQVDSSLNNILIDQTNECNKQFSKYIEDNYETLVKDNKSPILSPSVFKNHAQPSLDNGKKVCFIVIDCMRCDQFLSIYPYLESLFQVEMYYHFQAVVFDHLNILPHIYLNHFHYVKKNLFVVGIFLSSHLGIGLK